MVKEMTRVDRTDPAHLGCCFAPGEVDVLKVRQVGKSVVQGGTRRFAVDADR